MAAEHTHTHVHTDKKNTVNDRETVLTFVQISPRDIQTGMWSWESAVTTNLMKHKLFLLRISSAYLTLQTLNHKSHFMLFLIASIAIEQLFSAWVHQIILTNDQKSINDQKPLVSLLNQQVAQEVAFSLVCE